MYRLHCLQLEITVQKLPVLAGPLLAIQPPFDINFPGLLGYIRKVAFRSPWRNYFIPDFKLLLNTLFYVMLGRCPAWFSPELIHKMEIITTTARKTSKQQAPYMLLTPQTFPETIPVMKL